MELVMFLAFCCWFAATILVGYVAAEKNRSGLSWFFIAWLVSPLMAVLALAALGEGRPRTYVNKFGVVEGGSVQGGS